MAMGILQALKLQEGPIESLAQLPQQQLIAMSQQGRIPADVLPIILNEKAQMAQAAANAQAMARPMQPSVIEQAMAINAQAEAPQQMMEPAMDAGVASLPVPEEMYGNEYAGGGIVAFDNGGLAGTFDMFMPETQYESVGRDLSRDFKDTDTGVDLSTIARAVAPAVRPAVAAAPVSKPVAKESIMDRRKRLLEQMGVTDTTESELAELEKSRGKLADDKSEAFRMALIRAGLSMAAGTSPYALTNIAKGGIEGFETYGQSMKQIKSDEKEYAKLARDLRKEANAIKRSDVDKALALENQAELLDIERDKLKYTRQAADKTPAEIQLIERYAKDRGINFSQAMREISGLKAEPKSRSEALKDWTESFTLQKKYPEFEDFYNSTRSGGGGGGFKVLGKE